MPGFERMETASAAEVGQWRKATMEPMEAQLDAGARFQIIERMGRNRAEVNKSKVERALARRAISTRPKRFSTPIGGSRAGAHTGARCRCDPPVYTPQAAYNFRGYCSLWRGLPAPENASLAWCQCSTAFVATEREGYLGRMADVHLVRSCLSGPDVGRA